MDVTIFGIHLKINPVAFSIPLGNRHWDVYWYGIMIATGFLLAILYAMKNAKRFELDFDKIIDVIIVTVPVAILCARAYYVIFDGEKLGSIKEFFGLGSSSGFSGLAIYGGVIGAFVCGGIMCKIRKVKILDMFDLTAIGFIIGQAIGRWGNFFNQEAYGTFTGSSFFGMESTRTIAEMGEGLVHPCFLYESIWCLIGFFVLNHFSKKRQYSGQILLMYFTWYGFERGFIELIRTDSLMLGNLRVSSLLSFIICIGSVIAMVLIRNKVIANKPSEYTKVFDYDETTEDENGEDN